MKKKIIIAGIVLLLLCAGISGHTQNTVLYRTDTVAGQTSRTYAVMTPQVEVWAFGTDDIEVGRLWQVPSPKGTFLMAGGYYAFWPNQRQSFLVPYLLGKATVGPVKLAGTIGAYAPLNGGPRIVFSDEASATVALGSKVRIGVAASFWSQDGATTHRVGPTVSAVLGGGRSVSLRYLRGNAPDSFRAMFIMDR